MHHFIRPSIAAALAALALSACALDRQPSPAASAVPHGATSVAYDCPEVDPAQSRCKVPK